ncbi:MAG: hypothetical protein ACLPWD_05555 [Methanobacterium sp.]
MVCPSCGYNNNPNAVFCKKCGVNLYTGEKNVINHINSRINLLAVSLGLAVSLIILFIGGIFYGSLLASGTLNLIVFAGLVLFSMSFIGGIVTGLLGNDDPSDGLINGGFLSLILLINLGFVIGVIWLIFIAVSSYLASALQAYTGGLISPSNVGNRTSQSNPVESFSSIIQFILILIVTFFGGVLGGGLGAYIKKSFK